MTSNLTVSLELAKKMKELGWSKEVYFQWAFSGYPHGKYEVMPRQELHVMDLEAPTAQEILDELPYSLKLPPYYNMALLTIQKINSGKGVLKYAIGYFDKEEMNFTSSVYGEANFAQSLGQLWCWCKESSGLNSIERDSSTVSNR